MSAPPRIETFYRLIRATRIVQTLEAARELGVFEALAAGDRDLAALAEGIDVPPDRLRWLMDALVAMELVALDDDAYTLRVPPVAPQRMLALRDVAAGLRGRPAWNGDTPAGADTGYPHVVEVLADAMRDVAAVVGDRLARPGQRILELGAGACGWSLAVALRSPGGTVVANDLPAVLERAQEAVARAGCLDRYRFLPGDVFAIDLPQRAFDLVLVPLILHLFDETRGAELVRRAAESVAPGGRLVVVDMFTPDDRPDLDAALYSLELLCRTTAGRVHRSDVVGRWMEASGLVDVNAERLSMAGGPYLLTGHRPTG